MGYPVPKHFRHNAAAWRAYILDCAIRDRQAFVEAITTGNEPEPYRDEIDQTEEELRCMRAKQAQERRKARQHPRYES